MTSIKIEAILETGAAGKNTKDLFYHLLGCT